MPNPNWLQLERERLAAAQRQYDAAMEDADDSTCDCGAKAAPGMTACSRCLLEEHLAERYPNIDYRGDR